MIKGDTVYEALGPVTQVFSNYLFSPSYVSNLMLFIVP